MEATLKITVRRPNRWPVRSVNMIRYIDHRGELKGRILLTGT
jgi:hypothetical protein